MKQTETTKALLGVNKRIFKGLHDLLAINFEADFELHRVQLPKTFKAICKEFNLTDKTLNYLIIKKEYGNEFKLLQLSADATYSISFKSLFNCGLDNYYRKSDVEADRKSEKECYLLVADANISKEHFKNVKLDMLKDMYYNDNNNLYRIKYDNKNIMSCYFPDRKKHTEYGVREAVILGTNKNYDLTIKYDYYDLNRKNMSDITDLIDKSGYNVYNKRYDLKSKAEQLRNKKARIEIVNNSFSKENDELKNKINHAKEIVTMQLAGKNIFSEEYREIVRKIDNLYSIAREYNIHLNKLEETKKDTSAGRYWYNYGTIEEIKNSISKMSDETDKIISVYNS